MTDLTLHHRVALNSDGTINHAPIGDCVWCGKPTESRALTPFRPDLGALPLHLFCGQWMRDAFRDFQAGRMLGGDAQSGLRRLAILPRLESGQ